MIPSKTFVPLDKSKHIRQFFDCENTSINQFLKENANRGMKARINYTWVLPEEQKPETQPSELSTLNAKVCAFYTLSVCHIDRKDLPTQIAKTLPRYPLPVFVLAQLAVDKSRQGQG